MSPWQWYWKFPDDEAYGDECASREAVIAAAAKEAPPGEAFEIIEARMSEAAKYEYTDVIPFLRSRNHETVTVAALSGKEPG